MKDLLRIADLSPTDLEHLLFLGDEARRDPRAHRHVLGGDLVVTYFTTPSTRARLSFSAAVARLGGTPQVVGPGELRVGGDETIEDTAELLSHYARALVIRTSDHADVTRFADAATIPVVNAGTDRHHPVHALSDLLTLRRRFGALRGLRLAYLGDGNDVAHSLLEACAVAGVDITVATPPGYEPDPAVVVGAERLAATSGSLILTTHDPLAAVAGADAVYTDASLPRPGDEEERARRAAALRPYQVNVAVLGEASPDAVFMHSLPARRGEEVSADVVDGPRSVVVEQAENQLHIAQAILFAIVLGHLEGTPASAPAG